MAFAAHVWPADVETDETEIAAIGDSRDGCDHFVADKSADEAFRIGRLKRSGIVKARVPAFGGRPVDEDGQFLQRQRTDGRFMAHSAAIIPGEKDFSMPR